jgi:hypothetical protein
VTARNDLGANLNAPQTDERGAEFWSYSLLNFVGPGDVVFHYYRPQQAIVARSIPTGDLWEDEVVWAARGLSARNAGIQPHRRPGWYVGLKQYVMLDQQVSLESIRDAQTELSALREQLIGLVDWPLYFPFEMGNKRPLRPMQGYLFKLPAFFVEHFPQLRQTGSPISIKELSKEFGREYRFADENTSVGQSDPFSLDPALVERGLRSHATTQNALAEYLKERGHQPRSPGPDEPNFDLAWICDSWTWVAEVKSVTEANEETQLRLGLGQLLRYQQAFHSRGNVRAVLVIERPPTDLCWETLCEELDILLIWPENWREKLPI